MSQLVILSLVFDDDDLSCRRRVTRLGLLCLRLAVGRREITTTKMKTFKLKAL